jgi:flavin reductase (DIM6/NTAB) family NADH-FMN oxidoreductase RutF
VSALESADLRDAFSRFPTGLVVIAALVGDERVVLVASSFSVGVSLDPPMVSFAVQRTSTTWPVLADAPRLGVSVLGETHIGQVRQLAGTHRERRLDGVAATVTDTGAVRLIGAPLWLECAVEHVYPAGDHDLIVLGVRKASSEPATSPMVWHRSACVAVPPVQRP